MQLGCADAVLHWIYTQHTGSQATQGLVKDNEEGGDESHVDLLCVKSLKKIKLHRVKLHFQFYSTL